MNIFKGLSIHTKIFLITLLLCTSVAGITTLIFVSNNLTEVKNLNVLFNNIIKHISPMTSGIFQHKHNLVMNELNSLRLNLNIQSADLFSYKNGVFSRYSSEKIEPNEFNISQASSNHSFFSFLDNDFEIIYPIVKDNQLIGALYINTNNPNQDITSIIEIIALIIVITIFIAIYSERIITTPLEGLLAAMKKVTQQHDFSVRVKKESNDEVGVLVDTFNSMLTTIQENEKLERASQEQIKKLAYYDALSGLPNRDYFKKIVERELLYAELYNKKTALFYIDLNNINLINDTLGQKIGDNAINEITQQLSNYTLITSNYIRVLSIGQLSSHTFAILLSYNNDMVQLNDIAAEMLANISKSRTIDNNEISVYASLGIALYPEHAKTAEFLLRNAATAMHSAKQLGKNYCDSFHPEMNQIITKRMKIENALRNALSRNEFTLYYQPKFNLKRDIITGMEALIRWEHSELGTISPDEFIPIAEETDLIVDIGKWALFQACKHCKQLQNVGIEDLYVSVNVSGKQFNYPDLIQHIKQALQSSDLDSKYLDLELTESIIMMNDEKTLNTLQSLRSLGVRISIDDFGTGYSSLRYLTRYPINTVKIDKSFIAYILENENNAVITKAIIALAHNLNLTVVAEGVESQDQLEYLKMNDCDEIQGYLISKAVSIDRFSNVYENARMLYNEERS